MAKMSEMDKALAHIASEIEKLEATREFLLMARRIGAEPKTPRERKPRKKPAKEPEL